jgi:acyl-CoA synthetase
MEKLGISLVNHLENSALIIWNKNKTCTTVKYKSLLKDVLKLSLFIEGEGVPAHSTVGIHGEKSYALITMTLGILEHESCSFCYLKKDDIENSSSLDDFGVKYFFSDTPFSSNTNVELVRKLSICDLNYYFYRTHSTKEQKVFTDAGDEMNKICYTITTSGTTGKRKIVRATYNSIVPNITSLQKIFSLNSTDVILSSAPLTFDVFLVDLFLALHSGAALMIIPNELRFDTFVFDSSDSTGVTFLQITPTIFLQYGNENIRQKIMHAQSRLK